MYPSASVGQTFAGYFFAYYYTMLFQKRKVFSVTS